MRKRNTIFPCKIIQQKHEQLRFHFTTTWVFNLRLIAIRRYFPDGISSKRNTAQDAYASDVGEP